MDGGLLGLHKGVEGTGSPTQFSSDSWPNISEAVGLLFRSFNFVLPSSFYYTHFKDHMNQRDGAFKWEIFL
jgi:hypothetical protein